ncbi:MAG TPA: ribosome small subunit-dependent GTPase A [Clostridia bacterium]|nr:ribosome small subunit-dependent GTPase A [Clostridia bacterium]
MLEGIIVRGYSGFYYVQTGSETWECRLRGKYRVKHQDFLVGDRVLITPVGQQKGVIEKVLERKNQLVRPPVANVEQVVIVVSLDSPPPDLMLLDRLLVLAEFHGLDSVIVFNKADLVTPAAMEKFRSVYENIGYRVILSSARTLMGIDALRESLKDKISVLAGPSGVGKSSLLNAVQPGLSLKTGEVSHKTKRGRHTTRHVELMRLAEGGFVADTPGFSRLNLTDMTREELSDYFPEMSRLRSNCRFSSCLHYTEPDCAVRSALDAGLIDSGRYHHYLYLLEEVMANERRY